MRGWPEKLLASGCMALLASTAYAFPEAGTNSLASKLPLRSRSNPSVICPDDHNKTITITDPIGHQGNYLIQCGEDHYGHEIRDLVNVHERRSLNWDFQTCLEICEDEPQCVAVAWDRKAPLEPDSALCYIKGGAAREEPPRPNPNVWGAIRLGEARATLEPLTMTTTISDATTTYESVTTTTAIIYHPTYTPEVFSGLTSTTRARGDRTWVHPATSSSRVWVGPSSSQFPAPIEKVDPTRLTTVPVLPVPVVLNQTVNLPIPSEVFSDMPPSMDVINPTSSSQEIGSDVALSTKFVKPTLSTEAIESDTPLSTESSTPILSTAFIESDIPFSTGVSTSTLSSEIAESDVLRVAIPFTTVQDEPSPFTAVLKISVPFTTIEDEPSPHTAVQVELVPSTVVQIEPIAFTAIQEEPPLSITTYSVKSTSPIASSPTLIWPNPSRKSDISILGSSSLQYKTVIKNLQTTLTMSTPSLSTPSTTTASKPSRKAKCQTPVLSAPTSQVDPPPAGIPSLRPDTHVSEASSPISQPGTSTSNHGTASDAAGKGTPAPATNVLPSKTNTGVVPPVDSGGVFEMTTSSAIYGTASDAPGKGTPVPATNVLPSAKNTGVIPPVDSLGVFQTSIAVPSGVQDFITSVTSTGTAESNNSIQLPAIATARPVAIIWGNSTTVIQPPTTFGRGSRASGIVPLSSVNSQPRSTILSGSSTPRSSMKSSPGIHPLVKPSTDNGKIRSHTRTGVPVTSGSKIVIIQPTTSVFTSNGVPITYVGSVTMTLEPVSKTSDRPASFSDRQGTIPISTPSPEATITGIETPSSKEPALSFVKNKGGIHTPTIAKSETEFPTQTGTNPPLNTSGTEDDDDQISIQPLTSTKSRIFTRIQLSTPSLEPTSVSTSQPPVQLPTSIELPTSSKSRIFTRIMSPRPSSQSISVLTSQDYVSLQTSATTLDASSSRTAESRPMVTDIDGFPVISHKDGEGFVPFTNLIRVTKPTYIGGTSVLHPHDLKNMGSSYTSDRSTKTLASAASSSRTIGTTYATDYTLLLSATRPSDSPITTVTRDRFDELKIIQSEPINSQSTSVLEQPGYNTVTKVFTTTQESVPGGTELSYFFTTRTRTVRLPETPSVNEQVPEWRKAKHSTSAASESGERANPTETPSQPKPCVLCPEAPGVNTRPAPSFVTIVKSTTLTTQAPPEIKTVEVPVANPTTRTVTHVDYQQGRVDTVVIDRTTRETVVQTVSPLAPITSLTPDDNHQDHSTVIITFAYASPSPRIIDYTRTTIQTTTREVTGTTIATTISTLAPESTGSSSSSSSTSQYTRTSARRYRPTSVPRKKSSAAINVKAPMAGVVAAFVAIILTLLT